MSDLPGPGSPNRPDDPGQRPTTPFTGLGPSGPEGPPGGGFGPADSDGDAFGPGSQAGRMREQAADWTQPRPETVAEARARQRAQHDRAEAERVAAEQAWIQARKRRRRRSVLIGVAVVAVVLALLYFVNPRQRTTTAYCTDPSGNVVSESYCNTGHINPLTGFILLNGLNYRYRYGGTLSNGHLLGGSFDAPNNRRLVTPSGGAVNPGNTTSFGSDGRSNIGSKNIKRGGLGVGSRSGSGHRSHSHGGRH